MYDEEDQLVLEKQLLAKIQAQQSETDDKSRKQRSTTPTGQRSKQSRAEVSQSATDRNKLKFNQFLKCVLDFQLREHEKFLAFFVQQFKQVDLDRDGVVNE